MKNKIEKEPLEVIAGAPDKPLIISNIEIPCYVLEDETRVLSGRGMVESLGLAYRGNRLTDFAASKRINPFINNEFMMGIEKPIIFKNPRSGAYSHGYSAPLLVELCKAVLEARSNGELTQQQLHIADRCDILIRGIATVGIIALIDETTGYQEIRGERALATILEKFIAKELQKWTKTFPFEFYAQIFRLKNWDYSTTSKRPGVIGHYTNDFVYARIAPGVLKELRKINPIQKSGNRKNRHHQWFTPNLGHPRLKEHLAAVIVLMKISSNWEIFKNNLEKALPVQTPQMSFDLN